MNDDTNQFDLGNFKEVSDAMLAFSGIHTRNYE